MDDLIEEFIAETTESLNEIDLELVNLEKNPNDAALIGSIFRLMHTIKGTCGFLGLPRLETVAHRAENVLGRFRDGDLEITENYVTLIFDSIDRIKSIIEVIAETGSEPEGDDAELIEQLDAVYEGRDGDAAGGDAEEAAAPEEEERELTEEEKLQKIFDETEVDPNFFNEGDAPAEATEEKTEEPVAPEPAKAEEPKKAEKKAPVAKAAPAGGAAPTKSVGVQSLRVNVDVLENLMTMVSELVLTRNQLLQILRHEQAKDQENEFTAPLQRLNLVVSDLQDGVMKTRMQPVGNAWSKLPRIIRDIKMELDKKIELVMKGQDTELDRQVLDLIKDPLTHMVRNSADHGIESPADRLAAGKPESGTILLNAYHEGGHIIIEISDDGKGLNVEKIKEKIISNGLETEDSLAEMSDRQIQQYIFAAGFSTAEKVTAVSGRGVGMDVVRTNIEKIGGTIELNSTAGKGSVFLIKIPLTLAIVSALIVEVAGERFAIPQISVRELVMASETGENRIETLKGAPVLRLRDNLLPLISLKTMLGLQDSAPTAPIVDEAVVDGASAEADESNIVTIEEAQANPKHQYIIVAQVGSYMFGIIVDRVFDTEEIVVKPVSPILKHIELFSGNTILGDGSVIMILDPSGIARASGQGTMSSDDAESQRSVDEELERRQEKTAMLVFGVGAGAPKTVPLSLVARLESIDLSRVEYSSGQMLIQYRGELMPLIPFDASMEIGSEGEKPILVFSDHNRSMGLIVDEIVDIVEEAIDIQMDADLPGIMGSAIITGKATDVIDVGYYLQQAHGDWFKDHGDEAFQAEIVGKKILLVDDSPFFRNMLCPFLENAGYTVTTQNNPVEALALCETGADFDLIVSDIEMPEMNGFEFAEAVRGGDSIWKEKPMVALSSHVNPKDIERGLSVGFDNYVPKFDRDGLLEILAEKLIKKS